MKITTSQSGIDKCNCSVIRQASRRISRFYDAHLEPSGLKITQFLTLAALYEMETATVNALAERIDVERTAMGKMLGFLEKDGYLTVKPSSLDRRSRVVELTSTGIRLFNTALPLWEQAQKEFEQLNGTETTQKLINELKQVVLGKQNSSASDD
ncbi:MarR family winged helix-turn-helix transcriptional regulator [Martelella alba]|uniref:Winged helix-turn-helix transcriptional regulator n=1 Tax=Martelella alba TaxID=2590451 RepID=A0ABY2SRN7_9HYPH|nr:MarR family winged helix-turn-helix transcriptional regulator [Martelella alba]TKI08870.1 winged helix-turn-helix transcriptional regulator [Martelella alba]